MSQETRFFVILTFLLANSKKDFSEFVVFILFVIDKSYIEPKQNHDPKKSKFEPNLGEKINCWISNMCKLFLILREVKQFNKKLSKDVFVRLKPKPVDGTNASHFMSFFISLSLCLSLSLSL